MKKNAFLTWVFENRYNEEISDEEFTDIIDLNCMNFKKISTSHGTLGYVDDEQLRIIHNLLVADQKLSAVKLFKEISGLGLKESKDAIDEYIVNYLK